MAKPTGRPNLDHGEVLRWLTARQGEIVASVREMVLRESPTQDKQACDELCSYLAAQFECLGGRVRVHRQRSAGDHLQVNFPGAKGRKPVLLLGHFDTVYDVGTLQTMPWREEKGRLYGPGVFDMKSGIAQMMFALWAVREVRGGLPRPVTVLLVSDEEGGSDSSRALTEKIARQCCAVLVCEPSGPGGALKTARKGVGSFLVKITGKAAHAGLDFEKGQSAILELAHQILAISQLTDLKRGVTLNVGVIRGGTRTNVIAAEAAAEVDLRIAKKADGAVMERKIRGLRPVNPKCRMEIAGGINRPPMERTKQVVALLRVGAEDCPRVGLSVGGDRGGRRLGRQLHRRNRNSDARRIRSGWRGRARHARIDCRRRTAPPRSLAGRVD